MTNNFVTLFRQFAEERLKKHLAELNTKYENMEPASRELQEKAFENHRLIYEREIQDKIDSLHISGNPWIYNELQDIKTDYVSKLNISEHA